MRKVVQLDSVNPRCDHILGRDASVGVGIDRDGGEDMLSHTYIYITRMSTGECVRVSMDDLFDSWKRDRERKTDQYDRSAENPE